MEPAGGDYGSKLKNVGLTQTNSVNKTKSDNSMILPFDYKNFKFETKP